MSNQQKHLEHKKKELEIQKTIRNIWSVLQRKDNASPVEEDGDIYNQLKNASAALVSHFKTVSEEIRRDRYGTARDAIPIDKKLLGAVISGDIALAKKSIEEGADINALCEKEDIGSKKIEPMIFIALENYKKRNKKIGFGLFEMLVENGLNTNVTDEQGSPLINNVIHEQYETAFVKLIVEKGNARIDVSDEFGQTPLIIASYKASKNTVIYLIDSGADLNTRDYYEMTAVLHAVENNNIDIIKYLASVGAELDDEEKFNEFLIPMLTVHDETIEQYLELLTDKNKKNK